MMFTTNQKAESSNNYGGKATVGIVGAGAAGLAAAYFAAKKGAAVMLFEKNEKVGRKLRITGKGRCNLTNDCDINEFLKNVPTNPRFLYSALNRLSPADTISLFEGFGVRLKTERGRRVFPESDNANDIADALKRECLRLGVRLLREKVTSLTISDGQITGLKTAAGEHRLDAVILATGGLSYPKTGSDGDGYRFAADAGHAVTELFPSLVPLVSTARICSECQGLSLKNVGLRILDAENRRVYEDMGELMFAHFGLTGPTVLSASAHIPQISRGGYRAVIDMKPALDIKTLDNRLLSDFSERLNRDLCNSLSALLPQKLIDPVIRISELDGRKKVNELTKAERLHLAEVIKGIEIPLKAFRPIDEAIITKGGVNVKEVDPRTMKSKKVGGLFFAGELLDLDAYTGGYNLQIAFSTGAIAGEAAADAFATTMNP